jgi:hypothetical protein
VQGGFLGLVAVGNETAEEINEEVGDTAMAGVFDLRNVLELVDDGFDVTVANSKIDLLPPQAAVQYPAIPEGEMQKGRRSRCRPARPSPPLFE